MPAVLIRADGGPGIGGGHIARAKILSAALAGQGYDVLLLTKENAWSRQSTADWPCDVHYLRTADNESLIVRRTAARMNGRLIILDVQDTSAEYVRYLQEDGTPVITIDDPGRGADVADATFFAGRKPRAGKNYYYGIQYAILSPEVLTARQNGRAGGRLESIVCFFGTFDPRGVSRIVPEISEALPAVSFRWFTLQPEPARPNLQIFGLSQKNFFDQLASSGLALISGGVTIFEAAAVGCPSIVFPQVPHEADHARLFSELGAAVFIDPPDTARVIREIENFRANPERLKQMSDAAIRAIDGKGLDRFIEVAKGLIEQKKPARV